jgi:hypothetical protein
MKKVLLAVMMLFVSSVVFAAAALVPGVTNPDVTQVNIATTICVPNWTTTIRPPASYTTKLKVIQMKQFGLTGNAADYEEDHLISLELGGHPKDPKNLWPQLWTGTNNAHLKDALEDRLHKLVCSKQITLTEAQQAIANDWVAAYQKYVTINNKLKDNFKK